MIVFTVHASHTATVASGSMMVELGFLVTEKEALVIGIVAQRKGR